MRPAAAAPNLLQLPPELLHGQILGRLPTRERVLVLPLVCRALREVTEAPGALWHSLAFAAPERGFMVDNAKQLEDLFGFWLPRGLLTAELQMDSRPWMGPILPASALFTFDWLLGCFPGLRVLRAPSSSLSYLSLHRLVKACPALQHLEVSLLRSSAVKAMGPLSSLTGLRTLWLGGLGLDCKFRASAWVEPLLAALHSLSLLEALSIGFDDRTVLPWPATLAQALPRLQSLSVPACGITHVSALQSLHRLTRLDCPETKWAEAWPAVSGLSTLQSLCLADPFYTASDEIPVHGAAFGSTLTYLATINEEIYGGMEPRSPHLPLLHLPMLRRLLCGPGLAECLQWSALHSLESLQLDVQLPTAWGRQAAPLPRLTGLTLRHMDKAADLPAVSQLHLMSRLRELELVYVEVDALPPALAQAPLEGLTLVDTLLLRFDAATLVFLVRLTKLQRLRVCVCGVTDTHGAPDFENFPATCSDSMQGLACLTRLLPFCEPCNCLPEA